MTQLVDTPESRAGVGDELLRVEGINFSYGHLQILFDVSLEVRRGEALGLLGTNGAGKSTLLRVIAGLERASSGTVTFDGRNITGEPAERLSSGGLTLICGGRAVFTDMTVEENLEMQGLALKRDRKLYRERRARALETFPRLTERLSTAAGRLSGGEQQQLGMAKALLLDPTLLCIDELSLGLAPVVVGELMEIVKQLNDSGVTLIVVEQSLNVAAQLCDRSVYLEKGSVRFEGQTAELLEDSEISKAVFFGGAVS